MVTKSLSREGDAPQLLSIIQTQTIVVSPSGLLKRGDGIWGQILLGGLVEVAVY
jgi:hypothetical protein